MKKNNWDANVPIGKSTKFTMITSLDSVAKRRISLRIGNNGMTNRFSFTIQKFDDALDDSLNLLNLYTKKKYISTRIVKSLLNEQTNPTLMSKYRMPNTSCVQMSKFCKKPNFFNKILRLIFDRRS